MRKQIRLSGSGGQGVITAAIITLAVLRVIHSVAIAGKTA